MNKAPLLFLAIFVYSCGHHRDVRPGAKGKHKVLVQAESKIDGSRDAMAQANHYCGERNRSAVVLKEKFKYVGSVDEKTYNTGKNISKAAQILGSNLWATGERTKTQKRGKAASLGGQAVGDVLGEGYQVLMYFKCR